MWPENQVSKVSAKVEHAETLFDAFTTKKGEFSVLSLSYLDLYVLFLKQVLFCTYSDVV